MNDYKILIVDDQPENLEVIVNIVEHLGQNFEVLQALNGKTACMIAEEEVPDLVITDWEMPVMDGIEFIKTLKADDRLKEIPIIMCTGIMTSSENLKTALEAGAVDYIRKPVDRIELRARLQSMLALSDSFKTIQKQVLEIAEEKEKSDKLLLNILPPTVAEELKEKGQTTPRQYEDVSIVFTDFSGFTTISEEMSPSELVNTLDKIFHEFDLITEKYGLNRIKTIGDAYMCASGLPEPNGEHAVKAVSAAIEMRDYIRTFNSGLSEGKPHWNVRIGVNSGAVVAGVVGIKKFAYDIWGDAVNVASRMESSGAIGKVNISGTTFKLVEHHFSTEYRGKIEAKNKGQIDMYFVEEK